MRLKKGILAVIMAVLLSTGCTPSAFPAASGTVFPPASTQVYTPAATVLASETASIQPTQTVPSPTSTLSPTSASTSESDEVSAQVHFIDVGQGDSILVLSRGHAMLIDAGPNASGPAVLNYLNSLGIVKLDYLIGTHPHEDHIGGMDQVLQNLNVLAVYMPKYSSNTSTFEDVLDAIEAKNLTITSPKLGDVFKMGDCTFTVLAPYGSPSNANNASIVLRMTVGSISMLFEGDADIQSEKNMLKGAYQIKSDLIKIAHHGSKTSSYPDFIKAVDPKYAVITCKADNIYGLPDEEVLEILKGIPLYRTDTMGTIIANTDGKSIAIQNNTGN